MSGRSRDASQEGQWSARERGGDEVALPRGCSEGKRDRNKRPPPGVQKEDVKGKKRNKKA